jgi:outer membrane lipoprotein-sorting protein
VDPPRLEQFATSSLSDLQATVAVVKADQEELKKINRDFSMAYRLKDVALRYKEPNKVRMEGKIGQEAALYIVNGATRFYSVPKLRLSKKDNLGSAPGKRYSLLELGLLTRSDLNSLQSKFLREEALAGVKTYVFEVSYRGDESARNIVWIDAVTHVIVKRDWLDGVGKLRASFSYQEACEVAPSLWIPTRIEIRNNEGALAGVTTYSDLKVNQGLKDSLFAIS